MFDPKYITKILPTMMIAQSLLASLIYAMQGKAEWRQAIYWFAAATLTTVVTW